MVSMFRLKKLKINKSRIKHAHTQTTDRARAEQSPSIRQGLLLKAFYPPVGGHGLRWDVSSFRSRSSGRKRHHGTKLQEQKHKHGMKTLITNRDALIGI